MRLARLTAPLLAVAALAAAPAVGVAGDSAVNKVYNAYKDSGRISPCAFSESVLKDALGQVGPDIRQYAPDFPDAIRAAIEDRAQGACAPKKATTAQAKPAAAAATPATPSSPSSAAPAAARGSAPAPAPAAAAPAASTPAAATPQPAPVNTPAPQVNDDAIPAAARAPASDGSDDAPAPLLVLAVLVGAALLLGAGWAAARMLGFDPPWLTRWRHAAEEAGYRTSEAWSEFADWVRLGR